MSIRRLALSGLTAFIFGAAGLASNAPPSLAAFGYTPGGPTSQFGEAGSGDGQFSMPWGIAIDEADGVVYVVDGNNNRVQEFDQEGKYLGQFDGSEAPIGAFSEPRGIAVDNSAGPGKGDVYVSDVGHEAVDVFSSTGKYLSQLTSAPGPFHRIEAIAVDASGNVWVYENFGNVDEFSDTGDFIGSLLATGEQGPDDGLAVDANDGVYVLLGSGRVAKATGDFASGWTIVGEWGRFERALAVNLSTNNVFVDTGRSIEEFAPFGEPYGAPVASFADEELEESQGIAVDASDGDVYATQPDSVDIFKSVLVPDVSVAEASDVGTTAATISGAIKRDGKPASRYFQYGETTAYGSTTPAVNTVSEEEAATASLTELQPATTYHYRLVGVNENGTGNGVDHTFTTLPELATVNSQPPVVSDITRTAGLVTGTVDTEHSATIYRIEYVDAGEYEAAAGNPYVNGASSESLALQAAHGGESAGPLPLAGLLAGTTYHYRLVASNVVGTAYGPDYTFTTAVATPPMLTTAAAGEVTQTTATLSGAVQPQGLQTSYEFEVGTDTGYSGAKLFGNAGRSAGSELVSTTLRYLIPGTIYHYRLVATNEDGTTHGRDMTFTTPPVSELIYQPAALALIPSPAVTFPSVAGAITRPQASGKRSKKAKPRKRRAKGSKGRKTTRRLRVEQRGGKGR